MRVFTAVRHSVDPAYYYGGLWSGNFYAALRELGHEIVESQVDLFPASRFMHIASDFTPAELEQRARITEAILAELKQAHREKPLDLFLSYFYNAHFDPTGLDTVRALGIPSVNFYCNSIYQFDLVNAIAAHANFSWHAERDARQSYLSVGANPVWVQMGADPKIYHPLPDVPRQRAACFVGQRYADRDLFLAALHRAQVPFDLYGSGWHEDEHGRSTSTPATPHTSRADPAAGSFGSYIRRFQQNLTQLGVRRGLARSARQWRHRTKSRRARFELLLHYKGRAADVASTFASYDVCLNFSNVWSDGAPGSELVPHVRLRDFEAPMCRTCYLTGETDEIREFYEVGREIDTYRTEEELVDKTRFYLKNTSAAEKLRAAGYDRARKDHTWVRRFEELFSKTGLHDHREFAASKS